MLNLVQKFEILLKSKHVSVWHYPVKPEKQFSFFDVKNPNNPYFFDTLPEMIEEAYKYHEALNEK